MESRYKVTYKLPKRESARKTEDAFQNTAADLTEVEPYQYGKTSSKHDRSRQKKWKRIFLTGLSAIVIGTIFGLLLLSIFSHENDIPVAGDTNEDPKTEEPSSPITTDEVRMVELRSLSGHVIQAGAFQSSEKAKLSQDTLTDHGLDSIIWETETDERVFIALYQSKEDADTVGEQIEQAGIENYVREWNSTNHSIELTEAEHEWLLDFQALWKDSSTNFSTEIEQAWLDWLDVDPNEFSEELQSFYHTTHSAVQEMTVEKLPYNLLVLLYAYHNL